MKLKDYLKTFCFITFLFLGCCFTPIFAENWNGVEFVRGQVEEKDPITGHDYPYLLIKKEVPGQMDAFKHMILTSDFRPNMVVTPHLTYVIKSSKQSAAYTVFIDESDAKVSQLPSSAKNFQTEKWPLELIQNFPRKGPIKNVRIRDPRIRCFSRINDTEIAFDFHTIDPSMQELEEKKRKEEETKKREALSTGVRLDREAAEAKAKQEQAKREKTVSQEAPAAAREERAERKVAVSKKSTAAAREEREEIEKERRIKVLESKISHISAEISRLEALQIGEDEKRDRARRERKSCYSFDYRETIRKFRVNLKAAELERDRLLRD